MNPTITANRLCIGDKYISPQRDRVLTVGGIERFGEKIRIFHKEIRGTTKLHSHEEVELHD